MVDKGELERGWRYVGMMGGTQASEFVGHQYIMKVADTIDDLENAINSYTGSSKGIPQLGGEIAEEWVAKTFNIKATAAGSIHKAFVEKSVKHASVDVSTNFGKGYSLKYLKYADQSVKAQTKNVIQNYHEYLSQAKAHGSKSPMSFEDYLARYGYIDDLEDLLMSVYRGQGRIIPSDQLEEGLRKLRQLISTESARGGDTRLANLRNYQETLQLLSDRIIDEEGIESIPLTKNGSHAIAELCKTGDFRPEDFGITLDSEITREYILNQALKGGITAAVITLAIQLVPELLNLIDCLIKEKRIQSSELKQFGLDALSSGAKGFIIGGISCGIYTACKAGKLGAGLSRLQPGTIGTVAAISFNVMIETYEHTKGMSTDQEYKCKITRDLMISAASIAGGSTAVAALPIANAMAFVIGSMIGSVVASVTTSLSERILISFCVSTGYTLLGLVEQDYRLPEDVFKGMGLSLADLRRIKPNETKLLTVSLNKTSLSSSKLNTVDIQILKRGLISFHTVGYVF